MDRNEEKRLMQWYNELNSDDENEQNGKDISFISLYYK